MASYPAYIRPGIVPASEWKPKATPVASYDASRKLVTILDGYSIRDVLKSSGYSYLAHKKAWQRHCDFETFREDYELLRSLGVVTDSATAALLLPATKAAPKPIHTPAAKPLHPSPKLEPKPEPKPCTPIDKLKRAKAYVLCVANSEAVPIDPEGKGALTNAVKLIQSVLDEQERIEAEEQAYGSWQEMQAEDEGR